jgi:hypothetical protein
MNKTKLTSMSVLIAALFLLSVLPVTSVFANSSPPCTITVSGENIGDNAIQTAINSASPGQTVCVKPGTYPEQLVIDNGVSVRGLPTSGHPVLIQPQISGPNPFAINPSAADFDNSGSPVAPIVYVADPATYTATISGLTIDGSQVQSFFTGCGVGFDGVLVQSSKVTITNNVVENILLPPADAGCQPGLGIYVQTHSLDSSSVIISNNKVINYNKNGITCNDVSTSCWISWNTVFPYAPYDAFIAANGIQVAFGAWASVTDNSVSGNVCTLAVSCGPNPFTQYESIGILDYQAATGTKINDNKATANQIGIYVADDTTTANGNNLHGNTVVGLYIYDGTSTYSASKNTFNGNPIGIIVQSDGCTTASSPNCIGNSNLGYTGSYSVNIGKSSFYSTPTKVEIATMDGTVTGAVIVHFLGQTYSVSGDQTVTIV